MSTENNKTYFELTPFERATYHADKRHACSVTAMENNATVAELNRTISQREADIMTDVCQTQDGNGKLLYSNDTARKAERDLRMETDAVVIAAREEFEKCKRLANAASIDAIYHADMINILCAFAQPEAL